jgi:hypothetical protein
MLPLSSPSSQNLEISNALDLEIYLFLHLLYDFLSKNKMPSSKFTPKPMAKERILAFAL